jgi:hypothetical protein
VSNHIPAEVVEHDPEPENHGLFTLTISGLDYLRLHSLLRDQVLINEAAADLCRRKKETAERAAFFEAEARHYQRMQDGLRSCWKPGRAPGEVGRDLRRDEAIGRELATQSKEQSNG